MHLYQNKYRIASARWRHWDYANAGAYFITICTKNRERYFGDIVSTRSIVETHCNASLPSPPSRIMHLSAIGQIVESEWLKTPALRPDMHITLGEFVVMPDHFHAIVVIGENEYNNPDGRGRDAMHRVSTTQNTFGPQRKNLASIIRGFKSAVTIAAKNIDPGFAWQFRYHDRVIRDESEYKRIVRYILNNPAKWPGDSLPGGK